MAWYETYLIKQAAGNLTRLLDAGMGMVERHPVAGRAALGAAAIAPIGGIYGAARGREDSEKDKSRLRMILEGALGGAAVGATGGVASGIAGGL